VILVGEIRDKETAGIAVEAALTGHLLFSTLHTNDAPTTISRLTEMGIEPFMISASLICVCAQRLMRRVCKSCKKNYMQEGNEAEIIRRAIGWSGRVPGHSEDGCPTCGGSGYKGRVGIHELMGTSEELIKAINAGEEAAKIKRIAMRNGMYTLHQDSMLKVKEGLTTMAESLATVPSDMEEYESKEASGTAEASLAPS
jgi:type IV pilus assembly protein PilB